jgi:hypothetical protein
VSDYISKSALIKAIDEQVQGWGKQGIVPSLFSAIAIVQNQPTLDEKEIIRKPFERVLQRLEEELKLSDIEKERCIRENPLQFDEAKGYSTGISNAIDFVKEEGGIE